MHFEQDPGEPHVHDDHHHHAPSHAHTHRPRRGHNGGPLPSQWQVPHRRGDDTKESAAQERCDLDLLEAAFVEGFARCSDPTSFLRLAHVPFIGIDTVGRRLHLLRVEVKELTDIGALTPLLGGAGMRYAPLPASLASRRRRLRFVYHDGVQIEPLDLAAALALQDQSDTAE
jgi:hypothetical protein